MQQQHRSCQTDDNVCGQRLHSNSVVCADVTVLRASSVLCALALPDESKLAKLKALHGTVYGILIDCSQYWAPLDGLRGCVLT
jgi:hypothetical protein